MTETELRLTPERWLPFLRHPSFREFRVEPMSRATPQRRWRAAMRVADGNTEQITAFTGHGADPAAACDELFYVVSREPRFH